MSRDHGISALRQRVAWTRSTPFEAIRLRGERAFEVADRVIPIDLHVRDGEVRPTVLVDARGAVIADAYVGQEDEAIVVIAEGLSLDALIACFDPPADMEVEVEAMTRDHAVISVHGPFAWELVGEVLGPDLIGLPYLGFWATDGAWSGGGSDDRGGVWCLRAGKTGEYGYDLFVRRPDADALADRIRDAGAAFDAVEVDRDVVDQCGLENGFFNVRREGRARLLPAALGLSWRVSPHKTFVGSDAIARARAESPTPAQRLTWLTAPSAIDEDAPVCFGDRAIGRVLAAGHAPIANVFVAAALLDRPYFHAGIDRFSVRMPGGPVPVVTFSPPLLNNRSLYVNAQRHSYATASGEAAAFPPLV